MLKLFLGVNQRQLIDRIQEQGAVIFSCTPPVSVICRIRAPDGLLAIAQQQHGQLSDMDAILAAKKNPFLSLLKALKSLAILERFCALQMLLDSMALSFATAAQIFTIQTSFVPALDVVSPFTAKAAGDPVAKEQ